jgi:hypothetical protein
VQFTLRAEIERRRQAAALQGAFGTKNSPAKPWGEVQCAGCKRDNCFFAEADMGEFAGKVIVITGG